MNLKIKRGLSIIAILSLLILSFSACSKKTADEDVKDTENNTNIEVNVDKEEIKEENSNVDSDKKPLDTNNKVESTVNNNRPQKEPPAKVEYKLSDIMTKIISQIPADEHNMTLIPNDLYKDMYGIDASQFEEVLVYGSMMSVKANEIILIKVKSESDITKAEKILNERKGQVYKTWEQYLPDQFEMVKQSQIKTNGKYVALIIAPHVEKVSSAFMSF